MTEPRPADCTSPCIACMTDESHDPTPAPLSPPPADRAAEANAPTADRAAVLRDAADRLDRLGLRDLATRELRRMAAEAETDGARGAAATSVIPVIEHALVGYGYSPETARILIRHLLDEARAE
ncbi:hypothetical protein ACWEPO_29885 [Streptomyces albidoflavus]